MKVWEEEWEESDGVIEITNFAEVWQKTKKAPSNRFAWEQGNNVGAFGNMGGASPFNPLPEDQARAQLASAAPDMARVLLEVEWCGSVNIDIEWDSPACSSCGGVDPDQWTDDTVRRIEREGFTVGHAPDCALEACLRKAGVR